MFKQIRFGILSAERHPQIDERQGCLLALLGLVSHFLALLGVKRMRYPDRGFTSITAGKRSRQASATRG